MEPADTRPEPSSSRFSARHWLILLVSLLPFVVLPWTVEYWPGQDDPNHLALVHIIQQHDDPDSTFSEHFTVSNKVAPYKLYYYLLQFFSQFMDLTDANRIVVSMVILGLPMVMLFWMRRFAPERQTHVFLICLLASCMLPMIGFHSFMLGLLISITSLAFAAGRTDAEGIRQPPGWGGLLTASALLLLAAVSHPIAPALIGFTLFLIEVPGRNPKAWLRLAIVGTPALLFLCITKLASPSATSMASFAPDFRGILPAIRVLINHLMAYDRTEMLLRLPLLVALISAGILAIRRNGLRGQSRDACLARSFLVLLALFFLLPDLSALGYLPDRFGFMALLVAALLPLPCWVANRPRAAFIATPIICLLLFGIQYRAAKSLSNRVAEVVEAGQVLPRGAKVLPLMFDRPDHARKINPWLHSWGYLVIDRDIVTPYLFANGSGHRVGGGGWRAVTYKQTFGPDTMPYVEEFLPEVWANFRQYLTPTGDRLMKQHFLDDMVPYDRVLLLAPPEEFLEDCLKTMEIESHVGEVMVLKPKADSAPVDE